MSRYANLNSEDGQDALCRALEIPSVARAAKGKLSADDALGMEEAEAQSAFQIIRFYDTKGIPRCPRCRSSETYVLLPRPGRSRRWRCKHCTWHFSVTNGTMLHGRKMALAKYLAILSVVLDRTQVRSLLQFSKDADINYRTVWNQSNHFRAAAGTTGCTVPFSLLSREEFRTRFKTVRSNLPRFIHPKDRIYPYVEESAHGPDDGRELLLFVNSRVPRWMPDYMRADIAQDMILAILTGDVTRDQLSKDAKAYITKVMQDYPWKYKWISFDAPLASSDDGGISLHDVISDERAQELYDRHRG